MKADYSYYDLLAHIVPGTLFLVLLSLIKNLLGFAIPLRLSVPSELGVGIVSAFAIGHILQAISSLVEPIYEYLWRGKPSIQILSSKTKYFPDSYRIKLVDTTKAHFDINNPLNKISEYQQVFSCCKALVNRESLGRVEVFNAVYALHRVLLTTSILCLVTIFILLFSEYLGFIVMQSATTKGLAFLFLLAVISTAIEFIRTKERSYYYAREVLEMALSSIEQANRLKGEVNGINVPLH